jgi:hypothetical protein
MAAAGCSDERPSSVEPVSRRADDPTTSVDRPTTSRPAAPSSGPTGAPSPIVARVDQAMTFDAVTPADSLTQPGDIASKYRVGSRVVVWIQRRGDPAGVQTSAQFGNAEVLSADSRDGVRWRVRGRVPAALWTRRAGGLEASRVPAASGRYEVTLAGSFAQPVDVEGPAASTTTTVSPPSGPPDPRAALGADNLAGVRLGLATDRALEQLRAAFGKPTLDEADGMSCPGVRVVGWGTLLVEFGPLEPASRGPAVFLAYRYLAPHASGPAGPQGLTTARGLAPGMSLEQLVALEPGVVFTTSRTSVSLTTWYESSGAALGGRLSDDVTADGATVVEVGAGVPAVRPRMYEEC